MGRSDLMDPHTLVGIFVALAALWALLLVLFWVLRPNEVSVREILASSLTWCDCFVRSSGTGRHRLM